jgi:hypothetical protein
LKRVAGTKQKEAKHMSDVEREPLTIRQARRLPRNWTTRRTIIFAVAAAATLWAIIAAIVFYF